MGRNRGNRKNKYSREDMSFDDLLLFLSILEGELQARDEVMAVLKSERTDPVLLGAHYGLSRKEMALCALQRDSPLALQDHLQDVHRKSTAELSFTVKVQKHSYKQLERVCHSHSQALLRLEEQKKSHKDFHHRSNSLAALLEQDGERCRGSVQIGAHIRYLALSNVSD